MTFAGAAGFEDTDISDGSDETKLVVVMPETRREVAADRADGRDVNELLYGAGSSAKSCSCSSSCSMLWSASSSPGSDCSDMYEAPSSYATEGEGGSWSSGSS